MQISEEQNFELVEIKKDEFNWNEAPNQESYSWDFQKETIKGIDYKYYLVINNKKPESYFIFNEKNKYLAQFELIDHKPKAMQRLFTSISSVTSEVKIINVDSRSMNKCKFIRKAKLRNTVNQYEMELKVTGNTR